jgi:hypothetical protein
VPRDLAAAELTLNRVIEIEQGRGAPPTEQELAAYEKHKAAMAPVLRKLAASCRMSERKRSQIRRGMEIYNGLGAAKQKRWQHRTPIELFVHTRLTGEGRRPLRAGRRAGGRRARRVVASRDGPSEPSDEPPPVAALRGFMAASVRMLQHCERRRAKAAAA